MYIRFTTLRRDEAARTACGVFQAALDVWYERPDLSGCWQVREIRRELNWFNTHLNAPERMWYRPDNRAGRSGVCWFKPTATIHVRRARYMAWLLSDLGIATEELKSLRPGQIIWQDRHQLVSIMG